MIELEGVDEEEAWEIAEVSGSVQQDKTAGYRREMDRDQITIYVRHQN